MSEWQTIDSAPKDRSGILVIDADSETPTAGSAWWVGFWTAIDPTELADDDRLLKAIVWEAPTHWMPLPQPPKGDR